MEIEYSVDLKAVLINTEKIQKEHRLLHPTQEVFVAAVLSYYLKNPALTKVEEMKAAVSRLMKKSAGDLQEMLDRLLYYLSDFRPRTKDYCYYSDSMELAEIAAIQAKQSFLTVDMMIHKILSRPVSTIQELFCVEPKEETLFEVSPVKRRAPRAMDKMLPPVKNLHRWLLETVYGQDQAVSALVSGYFDALSQSAARRREGKPMATFLFAGAPGVGKTFLAETAAKALDLPYCRFDMSSFADKEGYLEFSGTDKVYRNAHEGLVTGFVNKNPQCVLLFDEIEKAHPNIIHLFLQILDKAMLKDSFTGENVSFKDALIIMTTNAGRPLYESQEFGGRTPSRKVVLQALANDINPQTNAPYFPAAICSRFATGNVVMFNPLGPLDLMRIAKFRISEYCDGFRFYHRANVEVDERLPAVLLYAEGGKVDARSLGGRADTFISQELYNWFKFAYEASPTQINDIRSVEIKLDLSHCRNGVTELFAPREQATVLLYGERPEEYRNFEDNQDFCYLRAQTPKEAAEYLRTREIAFAVCDITTGEKRNSLNIEDTPSSGRRMFETFLKEEIPFYVLNPHDEFINAEERQALLEQGSGGLVRVGFPLEIQRQMEGIRSALHFAEKLRDLSRANKVLTYDSSYEWGKNKHIGLIRIENLRISPAIDAEDQQEVTDRPPAEVTFADVIGAESAKEELQDFIAYLKDPRQYARNGIRAPKGVLLYGPPGTGKTMLAKAMAKQSGATFIATHGNQFLKSSLGGSAAEVNRIFAVARKYAPAVLFIDEIDIIAKNRMAGAAHSEEAVNALLNQMDGFSTNPARPVFVLAATNFEVGYGRESALDPAVLRRFDRRIYVDLPDKEDRVQFIRNRLKKSNMKVERSALHNIALRSTGMSLAELENVIDFALRGMLRNNKKVLTAGMLDEALEIYRFGDRIDWDEDTLRRIALHEAGHALVSDRCGRRPNYVTISGRASFGGYMQAEENSSPFSTQKQLRDRICVALAGRACETVFMGKEEGITTGAASDLQAATELAMEMITVFGMSESRGLATVKATADQEESLRLCNEILDREMARAEGLIRENKEAVQRLADALMAKNHLMGPTIQKILGEGGTKQ